MHSLGHSITFIISTFHIRYDSAAKFRTICQQVPQAARHSIPTSAHLPAKYQPKRTGTQCQKQIILIR